MADHTTSPPLFDLYTVFEVKDYLQVYRDDLNAERSDTEVASLIALLELHTPMHILDLACGFGRHANRLAACGHTVTGVDLIPGFLDIAREQAARMGVYVDYRQGDMRHLDLKQQFDRVLLLFTSFGYFQDNDNRQVLENVARVLKPGGLLCFDIPNRDTVLKDVPATDIIDKDGDLTINRLSFDPLTGRLHNRRILIRDGIRKETPFSIRLYNATEIRDLVGRAGLSVTKIVDANSQPLSAASRRMVIVASKRKPALT